MVKKPTKRQIIFFSVRAIGLLVIVFALYNRPHIHNSSSCPECYKLQTSDNQASYDNGKKEGVNEYIVKNDILEDSFRAYFLDTRIVFVTEGGVKYHAYGCPHIKDKPYWAYNIENAKYKGYSPCLDCEPGTYFKLTKATRNTTAHK